MHTSQEVCLLLYYYRLEDQQSEDRVYDGRKLGVSHRIRINLVKDFKYLGSWLLNCTKVFEIRKALAWKACIRLVKIWKSNSISSAVKIELFRACVELY
jgi:hypothetical protein